MNSKPLTTAVAVPELPQVPQKKLVGIMANKFNIDPAKLLPVLKETCFKGATDEQMVALLVVANEYGLNPFTREIYAFPAKGGGIVPVVPIDGWIKITNNNPQFNGLETIDGEGFCTCTIHRKDRACPTIITEYLEECFRQTDPWKQSPKRMLRHKAIIQCARVAFGFAGIHDQDEGKTIADAEVVSTRIPPPMPQPKAKPAAVEVVEAPPVAETLTPDQQAFVDALTKPSEAA